MQMTISLNTMFNMLQPLSPSNKKWLADRLYEDIKRQKKIVSKELVFPHLPADFKVSAETHEGTIGHLPKGVDFEKETEKMWEEWAK
jgi:hypothetical protein